MRTNEGEGKGRVQLNERDVMSVGQSLLLLCTVYFSSLFFFFSLRANERTKGRGREGKREGILT